MWTLRVRKLQVGHRSVQESVQNASGGHTNFRYLTAEEKTSQLHGMQHQN